MIRGKVTDYIRADFRKFGSLRSKKEEFDLLEFENSVFFLRDI